ncbi:Dedicator of cytokinesis protein 2, partial [Bienertia sinuspersici]
KLSTKGCENLLKEPETNTSTLHVLPVANRTRAQLREHARQIPLPLSDSSSSEEESEENFEIANPARTLKELAAPRPPQIQQAQQPQSGGMSLEEIVKSMASSTLQFQQETRSGLKNLENQVSQLANTVGRLKAQNSHKFPSQPEKNPRENCKRHLFKKWEGIRRTAC